MPGWPRGFRERFHCPVYMTASEFQSLHVKFPADQPPGWDFLDFYRKAGVADEQSTEMFAVMSNAHFLPAPLNHYRRLREGSRPAHRWPHLAGGHRARPLAGTCLSVCRR